MKPREKLDAMEEFRAGRIDILLTTSVVEVGVDVPNATVVIIDGADRFGMAQLHQFRGRVGRGEHQGYCILLSDNPSSAGQERLEIVEAVKDGFALAEEDLRIRGEGDLLGTVQSGIMEFKLADFNDIDTVLRCRDAVKELLDADPNLNQPENSSLIQSLQLDLLDP
jgi:ATP-dependent DNA helicase RecG